MIYIIKHRKYDNPIPEGYIEYGVGDLFKKEKDNLNKYNLYLNEVQGLYHIWKYAKEDIVGLCHYRRFFWYKNDYLKLEDAEEILKKYDIIVAPKVSFNMNLYYQLRFEVENSDKLDKYLNLFYKEVPEFEEYLKETGFNNREIFVCKKELIDKYCEWLFPIILPITEQFDKEDKDTDCNQRLISQIIERLFSYWLRKENLKIYEMEYKDI